MKKLEKLNNILLIHGEEIFLQEILIKKLKTKFINNESMSFLKIEKIENNYDEIINFLKTPSFSTEKKVLMIEDCNFLTNKGNNSSDIIEKLFKFIEEFKPEDIIIFWAKEIKIDKRKKFYKWLKKNSEIIEYKKYNEKDLINWITRYFDHYNKNINYKNARLIGHYSGYLEYESAKSLYDVKNEIDKIIAFTDTRYNIKEEDINNVMSISIDNNIFIFIDYIFERKTDKAYEMYKDMISNNISPHYIFYMIVRQIRMLNQLSVYKDLNYTESKILKEMKLRNFMYKKLNYQHNIIDKNKIKYLSLKAQEIDRKSKTGLIDIDLGINILISEAKNK